MFDKSLNFYVCFKSTIFTKLKPFDLLCESVAENLSKHAYMGHNST